MKKKLSRLNIDQLKQMYDVLDTELLRSVLGGLDWGGGDCAYIAIGNATGNSAEAVRDKYIGYLKEVNPGMCSSEEGWKSYASGVGVSSNYIEWLANQFGLSTVADGNTGDVLILRSGHAVNISRNEGGYYLYYDFQNGKWGTAETGSDDIYQIFRKI